MEIPVLLEALRFEQAGEVERAVDLLTRTIAASFGMGTVSGSWRMLPAAARLAAMTHSSTLRSIVHDVADADAGERVGTSRRVEQWAVQAWLRRDVELLWAASERAGAAGAALLAADLASDGELLARQLGRVPDERRFAERARERWSAIGVPLVAEARAARFR